MEKPVYNIQEGAIYQHPEGLRYRVKQLVLDATNCESGAEIKPYVYYAQLDQGHYPVGTTWVRELQDFMRVFTKMEEEEYV
jgi:hypothetical protein